MVFLSSAKGAQQAPHNEDVELRVMTFATKASKTLAKLIGGRGTLDLPCWSPDGKRVAFVSYQIVY